MVAALSDFPRDLIEDGRPHLRFFRIQTVTTIVLALPSQLPTPLPNRTRPLVTGGKTNLTGETRSPLRCSPRDM